jgi:hypothetical protein
MKFQTLEELIEFRHKILVQLHNNVCLVSFLKKDGETRVMLCTNIPQLLPIVEKKTDKVRKTNNYTISTFDINKGAFRSFLVENLLDIKILKPEEVKKYVVQETSN